jgi:hypothetical protein
VVLRLQQVPKVHPVQLLLLLLCQWFRNIIARKGKQELVNVEPKTRETTIGVRL